MRGCEALLKAIDAYIAKVDDNLEDTLGGEGFVEPDKTVEVISELEEKVASTLKTETAYIKTKLQQSVDLNTFAADWPEIQAGDTVDKALRDIFHDEFNAQMPKLATAYIRQIDEQLAVTTITKRTIAWVESWSAELGRLMKLTAHNEVERLLVGHLKDGKGIPELTKAFMDSGIRDEYYRARRAALTEMLRTHSVAQQEALTQNPAASGKEWVHTGTYRNEPRPNHVALSGTVVPKDQPFTLNGTDGTTHYPMYPRDSSLPAGESVNCHCIHRGIADETVLGLSLDERKLLQQKAIDADDGEWEKELDAQNRAKAGIEVVYKPNEKRYTEKQAEIHNDILENYNLTVHVARQNKHIVGAREYKEGRSILTAKPETLIKKYAGKSDTIVINGEFKNKERFEHTKEIGIWVSHDGRESLTTTRGTIHYSKQKGVHIVPAKPLNYVESESEEVL